MGSQQSKLEEYKAAFWKFVAGSEEGSFAIGLIEPGRSVDQIEDTLVSLIKAQRNKFKIAEQERPDKIILWEFSGLGALIALHAHRSSLEKVFVHVSRTLNARICSFETTGYDERSWRSWFFTKRGAVCRFAVCPEHQCVDVPDERANRDERITPLSVEDYDEIEELLEKDQETANRFWHETEKSIELGKLVAREYWGGSPYYSRLVGEFFGLSQQVLKPHVTQFSEIDYFKLPKLTHRDPGWDPVFAVHADDWFSPGHQFAWVDIVRHAGLGDIIAFVGIWWAVVEPSSFHSRLVDLPLRGPFLVIP